MGYLLHQLTDELISCRSCSVLHPKSLHPKGIVFYKAAAVTALSLCPFGDVRNSVLLLTPSLCRFCLKEYGILLHIPATVHLAEQYGIPG